MAAGPNSKDVSKSPGRVLLTGASGFLGGHCIEPLLAADAEIHAVSSKPPKPDDRVTWHQVDLLDHSTIGRLMQAIKPQSLVHLAWYVAPGKWYDAAENFLWLQASLEIVRHFHAAGGERLVVAGSGTEYDWNYGYCNEQRTPLRPSTYYGQCKNALRLGLEAYAANTGLPCSWARIFFLYGPREAEHRLIASVVNALLNGRRAPCTHGRQIRDFLHVQDAADALVFLLTSEHTGPINVGSGQPVALRELVGRVGRLLDAEELVDFGAIEPPPTDLPFVVADAGQLRGLGWAPRLDHDQGIADTVAWWRERVKSRTA